MATAKIPTLAIIILAALVFGCSQPSPEWTIQTPQAKGTATDSLAADSSYVLSDSTTGASPDVDEALDDAESYYATGVHYFQISKLDSAQASYEQALGILSELDLDPDQNPVQATRMESLLNEIEEDYRLTLISAGTLSSDASITAFRELFSDLKNFKKLRESGIVTEFNKADTAIFDIEIQWNDRVENSLIYLQTVAREKFTDYLERASIYLPLMEKIFKDKGLPHDLVYLPLIESGFKASAYSYARASGFWQFISATGRLYGLEHNWYYDERRDFVKSTEAAASHLKDLYGIFGDWNLALAAYNAGAGRISRQIKRSGTNNFWKLDLAKQTENYVPLYMAATIIAKQPNKYGFFPKNQQPLDFETVKINKCVSFANISAKTGIPVTDLETLNPELLRGITPPGVGEYTLRIPRNYQQSFVSVYEQIPTEKATSWAKHRVRRGETLSAISRKYGVPVAAILQANDLKNGKRLYAGQVLTVPLQAGRSAKADATTVASTKVKVSRPSSNDQQTAVMDNPNRYMVKDGDTLWDIASVHGVSISDLKRLNDLSSNLVYPGRWLKIPGRETSAGIKTAQVTYEIYRVRRGDNLTKIANKYGVSATSLREINNLPSNKLYIGMSLKIPSEASSNPRYTGGSQSSAKTLDKKIYTVRRGDTLWRIAKIHGVEIGDLAKWNNITPRSRISPGDKLKIYL